VWTFKRIGFLRPRITIREARSDSDLAVMPMSWTGENALRFSDGRSYLLRCSHFWRSEIAVFDSQGKKLMTLKPNSTMREERCSVKIEETALDNTPDVSLLAILSLHLMLLVARQDIEGGTIAALIGAGAI
jgi:hypothetical protein